MLSNITENLNDRQETFFVWVFNECVNNFKIVKSNKEISKETGIPVSTIEKYLKKFEDLGLIERGTDKSFNSIYYRWETTSREIILNSEIFDPFFIAKLRESRIEASLKLLGNPKSTIDMIRTMRSKS
jgi:DNA-binding MarR family transcriptional regulator